LPEFSTFSFHGGLQGTFLTTSDWSSVPRFPKKPYSRCVLRYGCSKWDYFIVHAWILVLHQFILAFREFWNNLVGEKCKAVLGLSAELIPLDF